MAFPETIVTFPTKQDVVETDGDLIQQYQEAIQRQDMATAAQILVQIPNYQNKIINASYLNLIGETVDALQRYFLDRYSPQIIVSATQPALQQKTDFWFEITN